jgi:hypothetical protein
MTYRYKFSQLLLAPFCIRDKQKTDKGKGPEVGPDEEQPKEKTSPKHAALKDILEDFSKIINHIQAWIEYTLVIFSHAIFPFYTKSIILFYIENI